MSTVISLTSTVHLFTFYLNSSVPPSFLTLHYLLTKSVIPVLQLENPVISAFPAIPILSKVSKSCPFFLLTIHFLHVNHIFNCRSKHTLLPAVLINHLIQGSYIVVHVFLAVVPQSVRAFALYAEGWVFEPRSRQTYKYWQLLCQTLSNIGQCFWS